MNRTYRTLIATGSSTALVLAGFLVLANIASGSTPVLSDSGTASCTTDSLGYCNGPTLPFRPNAVNITVQAPSNGPSQAMVALTATSFRARFFQPTGTASAAMTVKYSYFATGGATVTPPPTTTTTTPPPTTTTAPPPPTTTTPPPPPTTTTPPPTTTTSPPSAFPNATNTGVPAGTTLTTYTGPCTITTAGAVLNRVDASGCLAILIRAKNVTITNSLTPRIDATDWTGPSVSITDSTVKGGTWSDGAIWGYNITALRVNVTGGQHSFHCASTCSVTDSWLHDQYNPSGQSYHNNAFITNGGSNMVVNHNTLACTPLLNSTNGGCTADVSLFGDFEQVNNVTVQNNLLMANNSSISYCAYGGWEPSKKFQNSTNIKFLNNVFERGANSKCGVYGPATSFNGSATGNTWSGNAYLDGAAINQ
jgi:hypothetical protein